MKLVITGGHHSSALPVIKKLKEKIPDLQIYWLGHRHTLKDDTNDTLEYKEISALGIPFYELKAGKVYKITNIKRLLLVPFGFIQAFFLLLRIRPNAILSFGGYLAVPTVVAGYFLGIPSVTHEQTVVVGYANKVLSFFAKKILISWKESADYFPAGKTVYTGIPLRETLYKVSSNSFETDNGLPYIYITAGKTGSHIINEQVKLILAELLSFCNVIHQTGDYSVTNDYDALVSLYSTIAHLSQGNYFVRKFILEDEIGEVFNRASLLVSRAGAHTIAELLSLNKPALLIPIPWVSHNEQFKNAQLLKEQGLAHILNEENLTAGSLLFEIRTMLDDIKKFNLKSGTASNILNAYAAELIANETIKLF